MPERRAIGLWRLALPVLRITIAPVASALLRTESADFYRQLALTLRTGEEIPLEDLIAHLESIGYENVTRSRWSASIRSAAAF